MSGLSVRLCALAQVTLPREYYDWMSVFNWFTFGWDDLTIPGACLPSYFLSSSISMRTLLRGLVLGLTHTRRRWEAPLATTTAPGEVRVAEVMEEYSDLVFLHVFMSSAR